MNFKTTIHCALIGSLMSCTLINNKDTQIEFNQFDVDLGTLELKSDTSCVFYFTNTGKYPLKIHEVKTFCDCTVSEWPKKSISSQKSGSLLVKFEAKQSGEFKNSILVYYNGDRSPTLLTLTGYVRYPE